MVWFGRDRRFDVSAERWRGTAFGMRFDLRVDGRRVDVALPLAGPHFVENFLAAAAAAHVLGVAPETMAEVAAGMAAARHRGEVRRLGEDVVLLDDSYNSSPEALAAAVVALTLAPGRRRVAVVGDMLELGETGRALHRECGRALVGKVDAVVGVGPLAYEIVEGAREAGLAPAALAHFDDVGRGGGRGGRPRAPRGRGAGEGLAGDPAGGVRGCPRRPLRGRAGLMLYHLLFALRDQASVLNVTRYITFRTAVATLTALFLVLLLGPWMIERLRRLQIGQHIRESGPEAHHAKAGTPTMGGLLILVGIVVPTLLWADLTNRNVQIVVFSTLAFGAIGFADDYISTVKKQSLGLRPRQKLAAQFAVGLAVGLTVYWLAQVAPDQYSTRVVFPFFKQIVPDLGWLYVIFAVLLLTLSSNAVNLTDGLDGLAIGATLIAATAFTGLAYVSSHFTFSEYLDLIHRPGAGELTVFCGAMVGASMGFLWWNCYPAQVFMGDVGSLSLGGALGTVAILIKQELLLFLVGGLFMMEAFSVILQVASFRLTGKRIFRMSPLHHHFELVGWKEPQIIIRFWIVAVMFALFSLTTLKLR